jgi:hypothetical protein
MAHYLKNRTISSAAYAPVIPGSTSSGGPDHPVNGQIRYNLTNGRIEYYTDSLWSQITREGFANVTVDQFTGNGEANGTSFNLSTRVTYSTDIMVFIGGVFQEPENSYNVINGDLLEFTSPPPAPGINPNKIFVLYNLNSTTTR